MQVIQRIPATIYVSSDFNICVLILLYTCPHTTICVSSDYYTCVLILLYMLGMQVIQRIPATIYVSSDYYSVLLLLYRKQVIWLEEAEVGDRGCGVC
jgi:hypothetical protein